MISVIIPVYNVEKYLHRCLDSVIKQTYVDLEIILINDGSQDSSGTICDKYAKKDARIKVLHKQNAGVSAARNDGLDIATGEYVTFVDADDYVVENYIEILASVAAKNNAQVVGGGVAKFRDEKEIEPPEGVDWQNQVLTLAFQAAVEKYAVWHYVCAKLYKKSFLEDKRFSTNLRFGEDAFFNLCLCATQQAVINAYFIDLPFYWYYQRNDSAVHKSSYLDVEKRVDTYFDYFQRDDLNAQGKTIFAKAIIKDLFSFRYLSMYEGDKKKAKKKVCDYFPFVYRYLKSQNALSKKERIIFSMFYKIPLLYRIFRIMGDRTLIAWEKESKRQARQNKNTLK